MPTKKMPQRKLAMLRTAILFGLIFGLVWMVRLLMGYTDYTPVLYLGHVIDMPSVPRLLDAVLIMPLGGLLGHGLATLNKTTERDYLLASRLKNGMWLAALMGGVITGCHLLSLEEQAIFMVSTIGLLSIVLTLIACIPERNYHVMCGMAGAYGISFAVYYGGLAGVFLASWLLVIYEFCMAMIFLFNQAVRLSYRLFSWSCGL